MRIRYHTGFSLIELLVVMVIVGFIGAGVSLAINPKGSSAKQINAQGERLFAQMLYALDEALVRNSAVGLDIIQDEKDATLSNDYAWKRHKGFEGRDPKFIETKEPLGKHSLDDDFAWEITLDDDDSLLESLDKLLSEDDEIGIPEILFYPSGEVTKFSVVITLSEELLDDDPEAINERYKITLNERGQLVRYQVGVEEK